MSSPTFIEILTSEAEHYQIEILTSVITFFLSALFNPTLRRIPRYRRIFSDRKMEPLAGCYIQVISGHSLSEDKNQTEYKLKESSENILNNLLVKLNNGEYRFSIIDIYYNEKLCQYVLKGRQYDSAGMRTIVFTSHLVSLKEDILSSLEFVWRTEAAAEPQQEGSGARRSNDGYSEMVINDPLQEKYIDGSGFFISFKKNAEPFDYWFFRITENWCAGIKIEEKIKLSPPKNEGERVEFVKYLVKCLTMEENRHLLLRGYGTNPFI